MSRLGRLLVAGADGRSLAAGFWDKCVLCWSLPDGEPLPAMGVKKKRKQPIAWRLAFRPRGKDLAIGDDVASVFDTSTGKLRFSLPASPAVSHPDLPSKGPAVFDLAYDPTGRLLATANGDGLVRWWDAETGAERARHDCGIGGVTTVAFSLDRKRCAAGGEDGRVAVWDVRK
jgi:WD40 repeat protein